MSDWHEALAPTPECIALERVGDELDAASREHLATCARCQTELALFREITSDVTTSEETAAAQQIASELQRRAAASDNVVTFRPRPYRALYAAAAALLLLVGIGVWMQLREPAIDDAIGGPDLYRSARLELVAPRGDVATPPNELRWTVVPNATRYQVRLVEVDGTLVWSGETNATHIALPPAVIQRFAPGKRLSWDVQAFRGTDMLAASDTQPVRVTGSPRNDR